MPPPPACAASPSIPSAGTYIGLTSGGRVGQWEVDTAGLTTAYDFPDSHGAERLARSDTACSFTTATAGGLHTALLANGLGITAASLGGVVTPVILVSEPERSLAAVAGTYNVLRRVVVGSTVIVGGGAFHIEPDGQWSLCPASAYSPSCAQGLAGRLAEEKNGIFDIIMDVMGEQVHAKLLVKTVGADRLLAVAVDNGFNMPPISGFWLGTDDKPFATAAAHGPFLVNGTDASVGVTTLSGLQGLAGTQPFELAADTPQPGLAAVTGDQPDELALLSGLGLFATVYTTPGGGDMRFGLTRNP